MNLNVTSNPTRSRPEELVPSRYAVRIGEIDVLVVSDGVLPLPTEMLAPNAEPDVRAAWLDDMFLPRDAFDWALNAVVVRSGNQTILVDAGLGSDPDLHLPRAGQLIKRLEAAGIDLSSVTDVVLTHMHMDHVGGLLVDGVKERLRRDLRFTWPPPKLSSGKRRISLTPQCRRVSQMHFEPLPSGSRMSIAATCEPLRRSTRLRQELSSAAPVATRPGIVWSAWRLVMTR